MSFVFRLRLSLDEVSSRVESATVVPDSDCVLCPFESDLEIVVQGQDIVQILHQEAVSSLTSVGYMWCMTCESLTRFRHEKRR
jgi:hypothetical protein